MIVGAAYAAFKKNVKKFLRKFKTFKNDIILSRFPFLVIFLNFFILFQFIWQYKDNGGKWANYDPAASDIVEVRQTERKSPRNYQRERKEGRKRARADEEKGREGM